MKENRKNVVCIIGMHRSGTSMIAQLLNLCGLDLGPSERFLPANEFNPSGYFENEGFVNIDEALLTHLEGSWDNPPIFKEGWEYDPSFGQIVQETRSLLKTFSGSSQWGWKDPRTTVLLPFWKLLIPDLRFVICIRSPLEVAKSLARRDRMPFQKGVYLWNQYMRAAIRDTEGCSRIFTFYEDFFNDATTEINRLIEFCGLQKPDDLSSLHGVISHELKHHTSETSELLNEDKVITEYKLFYIGLRALTTQGFVQPNSDHGREEFTSENICKFFKLVEQFHDEQEMAQLQSALADKEQQVASLHATVHELQKAQSEKEEYVSQLITKQGALNQELGALQSALNQKEEQVGQFQTTVQIQQELLAEKGQHVEQLQAAVQAQEQALIGREQQVTQLTAEHEQLLQQASQLQTAINSQQQVLHIVHASWGWKLLNKFWQLENKLLTPGTKRRRLYDSTLMTIRGRTERVRNKSKIPNVDRINNTLMPIGTRRKKVASLIYRLPASLTRKNLGDTVKYLRLYGLAATYGKIKSNLWSDGKYVFFNDGAVKASPAINIRVLKEEVVTEEDTTISVVIPVKNAGDDFRGLLSQMKNQKGFRDVEIIVVDSGSTDRTLETAREFGAKIIEIKPEEFSHSYARNLGAECASGDYLLFTVQDALPPSNFWLYELFGVIKGTNVVAVSCAEFPREDADLFYRVNSWQHDRFMEVDRQDRLLCKPDSENQLTLRKNANLSDVACLISRDVFMQYKFRGNYAEDLDLGLRLITDGHKLALLSSTRIIHSHNRPAYYHLRRGYVDVLSLLQVLPGYPVRVLEADRLFRDLLFTYGVVNLMVHQELQQLVVPCKVNELSSIVTEKFGTATKGSSPHYIEVTDNGFVDSEFTSFLQDASKQCHLNGDRNSCYDGVLLHAIQFYADITLEYLDNTYELIDDRLLSDFKSYLYKVYAYHCGAFLASCFLQASGDDERIREINNKLNKGI